MENGKGVVNDQHFGGCCNLIIHEYGGFGRIVDSLECFVEGL